MPREPRSPSCPTSDGARACPVRRVRRVHRKALATERGHLSIGRGDATLWNRRPRALAYADRLAQAVQLDMAQAGGSQQGSARGAGGRLAGGRTSSVDGYLGRVTKARTLQAVREARRADAADRIAHLKKGKMAEQAQELLAGSGWLPERLRTPGQVFGLAPEAVAPDDIEPESEAEQQPDEPDQAQAGPDAPEWPVAAE